MTDKEKHYVQEESPLTWERVVNKTLTGKQLKEVSYSNQNLYIKLTPGSTCLVFSIPKKAVFLEESTYHVSENWETNDKTRNTWLEFAQNKVVGKNLMRVLTGLNDVVTLLFNHNEHPLIKNTSISLSYSDVVILFE